jgi:hypothetical protein
MTCRLQTHLVSRLEIVFGACQANIKKHQGTEV